MQNWPIFGLYQPDDVVSFTVGSRKLLATANEGNSRELTVGGVDITDEWKGKDFITSRLEVIHEKQELNDLMAQ